MQSLRVNGTDMAYLVVGQGPPPVCVHGALGDFRTWSTVLGPLSKKHRVIAVSLRHFFPGHWDSVGDDYSIAQHIADMIAFIEQLGVEPLDLMGHSRGAHISFRLARRRPDLLRKLILAEPGGEVDASLDQAAKPGAGAAAILRDRAGVSGGVKARSRSPYGAKRNTGLIRSLSRITRRSIRATMRKNNIKGDRDENALTLHSRPCAEPGLRGTGACGAR